MRSRTLLTLLAVFFFASFVARTILLNQQLVTVHIALFEPLEVGLWLVMFASFGAGAILILLFDLAGSIRRYLRALRERQQIKVLEEKEELYLNGLDAMVNGRYRKAILRFDEVLDRDPDHVSSLVKKGDSLRFLKRYREAAQVLEKAVRLEPEHVVALYSLSDLYAEVDADERAKIMLERIIERSPETSIAAHFKLRDLLVRGNLYREASRVQRTLVSMLVADDDLEREGAIAAGLSFAVGEEQLENGEPSEAANTLESVLAEDDRFTAAYVRLGEAQAKLDQTEKAIETWRTGYEKTNSVEPLVALQDYFLQLEQPEAAIGVWKNALVLSEDDLPLRYCLGKLYYRLFMLDEALKEFQTVEDSGVEIASVHFHIARILESKGEFSDALVRTKLLLRELERSKGEYRCLHCESMSPHWTARCSSCGEWNRLELDVPKQREPQPEIRPAPTWSTP